MLLIKSPFSNDISQFIRLLLFITFTHISPYTSAQRGPGGVGNTNGSSSLIYWIDANQQTDIAAGNLLQISDLSGNNGQNTILGNPTVTDNYINQLSAVNFNGLDQQILTDIFINAALHPNLTVIAVYRPGTAVAGSVWGDYQSGWEGRYITNNAFNIPRTSNFVGPGYEPPDATHPSTAIPGLFTETEWVVSAIVFREDIVNGTQVRINGELERSFTSDHNPGAFNYLTIGAGGSPDAVFPFWFNGHVAEIIVFDEALNDLDLVIIENYLSAKYAISLAANNLYLGDDYAFDYDVAGIGSINAIATRNGSQGTGIVNIEADNIDDDQFLLWGHNNGGLAALEINDVPAGVEARSNRIWYVSEVNSAGQATDIGALNIAFELLNLGAITASDLVLLIDTDQDGLFADETPINGAYDLNSNIYQFQNVTSISNGSRFTFGSSNINSTPLPVALLSFQVSIINPYLLDFVWTTASELNNDYFEILESKDGFNWQSIIKTNGAGNSNKSKTYSVQYEDIFHSGNMYYKLRQTDFQGISTDLKIEKVTRDRADEITLFPNPASTTIKILGSELKYVDIYDSQMKLVKTTSQNTVQVNDLEEGVYLLFIYLADKLVIRKACVRAEL